MPALVLRAALLRPLWRGAPLPGLPVNANEILAMLTRAGVAPRNLSADSRTLAAGDLFLAYPGHAAADDGRHYIAAAVAAGAGAVLWERDGFAWDTRWQVPNFAVDALKTQAGPLAAALFGAPSAALNMIGVTGTNGKTSVTQWIAQALARCATPCAVIGTLGARFGTIEVAVPNTTPDAIVLQRLLARMRDAGAAACALEVSSIGLDQSRLAGVDFDIAVFTNLSRDHLDYHGDMAAYEAAKTRLFMQPGLGHAVINVDDPMGLRLLLRMPAGVARIAYSIAGDSAAAALADQGRLIACAPRFDAHGVCFDLDGDWGTAKVAAPVWGRFNLSNLLAVIGSLLAAGAPLALAVEAVANLAAVPGRMNALGGVGQPLVVIDYAHTPDALEKALTALRPLAVERGGRLLAVFGCGGDRDAGKRAPMGEVAARLADAVILTTDNPRSEAPTAILAQIARGAPQARVLADRAQAIRQAIRESAPADVVLVAGKGHEATQEISGRRLPFSDHDVARNALDNHGSTISGTAP